MPEKKSDFFNGFDNDIIDPDDFQEDEPNENDVDSNSSEDDGKSLENEETNENEEVQDSQDDDSSENAKTPEESEEEKKQRELHEKNEKEKQKRLAREQKEREEKIKKDAKLEAELGILKTNPFTNEPINDEDDLEIYKLMKEIDDNGGDAISDLPKAIAEKNRKAKEEAKKAKEKEQAEKDAISNEIKGFHERHPEITVNYLKKIGFEEKIDDPKYNGWSYAERVNDFINNYNNSAKEKSDDQKNGGADKKNPPSSNSNGGKQGDISYMDMSDEEYLKQEKENNLDFF